MNYSRMSLPSGCRKLMHHASCTSAPQTTGKPTGMRGHCSLLTFPQLHLKTWVTTKVSSCSRFWLQGSHWHPPRDANNCDAWWMLMGGSSHTCWLTALCQTKCTRAPTKGTAVLQKQYWLSERHSQASLEYLSACNGTLVWQKHK